MHLIEMCLLLLLWSVVISVTCVAVKNGMFSHCGSWDG